MGETGLAECSPATAVAIGCFGARTKRVCKSAASVSDDDGLQLIDCAITAAVHCAPPDNKPSLEEIDHCRAWLDETFDLLQPARADCAGSTGLCATLAQVKRRGWWIGPLPRFAHAAVVPLLDNRWLIASYHPSQQNTFTGKLTEAMFDRVFRKVA